MAYKNSNYRPNKRSRAILARAWEHVQSVPYRVTARWLFYCLLQDGFYGKKEDYQRFLQLASRARHNYWEGWRPYTLEDDTRRRTVRGTGDRNAATWVEALHENGVSCSLDKWVGQSYYIQIWFEANAMVAQFKYHTKHITLVPFGGMPSIPYKYEVAYSLDLAAQNYALLPLKVLYFGDYDPMGLVIPETSISDIRDWCTADFDVVRVGLNAGDGTRYGIPENPEKPGQYQWEALSKDIAAYLIESSVARYVDIALMEEIERTEDTIERQFIEFVQDWEPVF